MAADLQLFHRISDPDSAQVRKWIVEFDLQNVSFRNVDISEGAAQELRAGTGDVKVPMILTAEGKWIHGLSAIESYFRSLNQG